MNELNCYFIKSLYPLFGGLAPRPMPCALCYVFGTALYIEFMFYFVEIICFVSPVFFPDSLPLVCYTLMLLLYFVPSEFCLPLFATTMEYASLYLIYF